MDERYMREEANIPKQGVRKSESFQLGNAAILLGSAVALVAFAYDLFDGDLYILGGVEVPPMSALVPGMLGAGGILWLIRALSKPTKSS